MLGGLIQFKGSRNLQYVAFLASLFADYLDTVGAPGWNCGPKFLLKGVLRDFATSQVDIYICYISIFSISSTLI